MRISESPQSFIRLRLGDKMKLRIAEARGPPVTSRSRSRLSRSELSPALETLAVLHGAGLAYRRVNHTSLAAVTHSNEGGREVIRLSNFHQMRLLDD